MRESLVSIGRVVAFMTALVDQMKQTREMKDNRARIRILQRDIQSLTDHASFLSGKISFLLDAVLGLISHRAGRHHQDILGGRRCVPAANAGRQHLRHEFPISCRNSTGYRLSFGDALMVLSAILPLLYFKQKGWL